MTPLTSFLAEFLGAYLIAMSIWLLIRRDVALQLVERVSRDPVGIATIGMIRLGAGLAIVVGHDLWNNGTAILVSLVGWITLLNGLFTLLAPSEKTRALVERMRFEERSPAFALFSFLLGAALLIGAFTG